VWIEGFSTPLSRFLKAKVLKQLRKAAKAVLIRYAANVLESLM